MNKLFLLDAYALIFRAYYAFIKNPMRNAAGINTSAVWGFTKFLRDLLAREKPHYVGVAFDPRGGNFRHALDPNYKANRAATPEDIVASVPYIKRILDAMCIPVLEVAGYEADDVIGTLAREAAEAGFTTFMVTPDKDYGQLVGPHTSIYKQRKNGDGVEIVDSRAIKAQYGIDDPRLVADILALWGDASDNVPGVPGIGEKGAMKLVGQFGTVENILDNASKIGGRAGENIAASRERLLLSKRLVTIDTAVPVDFVPAELEMCDPDFEALTKVYKELGFNMFLREISTTPPSTISSTPPSRGEEVVEQDLFSAAPVAEEAKSFSESELNELLTGREEFAFMLGTAGAAADSASATVAVDDEKTYRVENPEWLAKWLADAKVAKVGYDLKAAMHFFHAAGGGLGATPGEVFGGRLFDVMILGYLLDPEGNRPKPQTAAEAFGMKRRMWETLRQAQGPTGLAELYQRVEEPLIGVLAEMEREGIRIDTQQLNDYARELAGQLTALETEIRELTGEETLNVNSSQQLGEALFGKMRLTEKPARTKTRQYRTDEETLAALADRHPVVEKILEYRGVKKLLSTYVEALPRLVDVRTGRIHTTYNQAVTATGRLSSTNPNLQNIPIREAQGRPIRRAFVPSDDDHVLLAADYSQVELRIMAHLSEDQALIEAFRAGEDVHRATAARIFGVALEDVTIEQRRRAKTANFGIIYGISAFGLATRLGIDRREAAAIIDGYFRSYPGVRRYMENVAKQARERGFVETLMGRRRYLPDINSANAAVRALAERNAVNAPIQGSAADIMKVAMVRIHEGLRREGLRSRMILQVHDEVVLNVRRDELERVRALVEEAMEHAARLAVDLVVESGWGNNWLAAH